MPKERVHIKRFDGVIGVTDAHDLPEGAAYYAENLDIVTQDASFVGLPNDESYTGNHAGGAEIELFEDGNTGLSYSATSGHLKIISFDHDAKTVSAELTSSQATGKTPAMASSGQAIHVGMGGTSAASDKPLWAGKVYTGQADITGGNANKSVAAGDYLVEDATITSDAFGWCVSEAGTITDRVFIGLPPASNTTSASTTVLDSVNSYDSTNANLRIGRAYRYYASAVYDGSQEAPVALLMEVRLSKDSIQLKSRKAFEGEYNANYVRIANEATNEDKLYIMGNRPAYNSGLPDSTFTSSAWRTATGGGTNPPNARTPAEGIEEFGFFLKVRLSDNSGSSLPTLNRRVTGVKIYRSEVFTDESGKAQESEPAFINFYKLYNESGVTSWFQEQLTAISSVSFAESGDYIYLWVLDSLPGTYTFEQNTGYAATLDNMNIHWATSCISNAYHIIGNCWSEELEDVDTWLFRSKPFRYNTFDWSREYLVLPSKPTALVSYGGRVYAFSASRVYVIDPIAFDIEETWEGVGCDSEKSIVSTESGLFWASRTGIYHFIANEVMPIGLAINRLQKPPRRNATGREANKVDVGWLNHNPSYTPVCAYSPVHNALVVMYKYKVSGGRSYNAGLIYHVPTQRWVPFTPGVPSEQLSNIYNAHTTSRGDVLYGNATGKFSRMFTAEDSYRRWRFISRQYGEKGAVHKYYHAYVSTSDINNVQGQPPSLVYYDNDSAYNKGIPAVETSALDDNPYLHKYELTENGDQSWNESRTFAIELNDSVGTSGVDCSDVTIIRRRINPR